MNWIQRLPNALLYSILLFFAAFLIWANLTELDEVTRGSGRVVPSSQLQVVQNLEGGIIKEIYVRQGQIVRAGEPLVRLDKTRFDAELGANRQRRASLLARMARLEAEIGGTEPNFDRELTTSAPDIVKAEITLFESRRREAKSRLDVFESRIILRQAERDQARQERQAAARQLGFATKEWEILAPLVERGVEPQLELIRAEQRVAGHRADMEKAELDAKRLLRAIEEARSELAAAAAEIASAVAAESSQVRAELVALEEGLAAFRDRVERTIVRAPVDGVVNRLLVTTEGGVVQPGMSLVEIVPVGDTLLIEARIRPTNIAFLAPGQEARVKITAYDYAVYGALEGRVESVGADTITDPEGETYFLVRVRTDNSSFETSSESLPILPGMTAEVDILSGKRTIMNYLLTPVTRIRDRAFRER